MLIQQIRKLQRVAAIALCLQMGIGGAPWLSAQASSTSATGGQLEPYTTRDHSASAGVPSGWRVIQGADTVIVMDGPQNERIFLGKTFIARNGAFQLGQRPVGGVDLTMPYGASLAQKFSMLVAFSSSAGGTPSQLKIISAAPIQVPAILGQCGRFIADGTSANGPVKIEALLCSLPIDSGGVYKNIFKLAQAPATIAAQERATAEAVFASYRVPQPLLRGKLAPFTPLPMARPGMGGVPGSVPGGVVPSSPDAATTMANCFDLTVLRDTPRRDLPPECGGPERQ